MKNLYLLISAVCFLLFLSCASVSEIDAIIENEEIITVKDSVTDINNFDTIKHQAFKILALGDSYTIGQSVCNTCRFPEQLVGSLLIQTENKSTFPLKIIARTGWTTTNLINAIASEKISTDYNLVTLLIGVNNQYQNKSFSLYKEEFPKLVNMAIKAANSNMNNVIVVSIPDYAFTPFGQGNPTISSDIKKYNDFAKSYCTEKNITFLNITDITKMGLSNTALVANDGLHPSKLAYTKFVERLLPIALEKLAKQ